MQDRRGRGEEVGVGLVVEQESPVGDLEHRGRDVAPQALGLQVGEQREAMATASKVTNEAGSSRRIRRAQKALSEMPPVALRSPRSSDVMRNPDSVKNVDTPR